MRHHEHALRAALAIGSLALIACSGGGYTSLEECRERCDRIGALCGSPAGSCMCTQSQIDRSNRCAERTGCADLLVASNECLDSLTACDLDPCEDDVRTAGERVQAWCGARPTDECCVGAAPLPTGMGSLGPGEELAFDGVIERDGARWAAAPFPHEVEPGCPLPDAVPALPSPADLVIIEASADVTIDVTMTRDDGEMFSARTGLIALPGATLPNDIEAVHACLDWDSAGGTFPAELMGLPLAGGDSVVLAIWAGPGDPEDVVWQLRVVAR